jgi:hypothetical protein
MGLFLCAIFLHTESLEAFLSGLTISLKIVLHKSRGVYQLYQSQTKY